MINICPLFSGSSGNSTYIEVNKTGILLDAGVSMKKIVTALERIGKSGHDLSALLITHEHIDHILSLGALARRFKIPVYATVNTWRSMIKSVGKIDKSQIKPVFEGKTEKIDNLEFTAFEIPHDAAVPVGYTFSDGEKKLTVATDLGEMNEKLFLSLSGSDGILLEANHDTEMLLTGSYPYPLKKRIKGKFGHLSNDEAAATCARLVTLGTKTILLGHLSAENNRPETAFETVSGSIKGAGAEIGKDVFLDVILREQERELQTI